MDNALIFLERCYMVFVSLPIHVRIGLISFSMTCLSMIIWIINIPVFNFIVIPLIKKRLGRKMDFSRDVYRYFLFGNFLMRSGEVVRFIVLKYLAWKFKKNPSIAMSSGYALQRAGYEIEDASRFEIFMSFFMVLDCAVFALSLVLTATIAVIYGNH